jgi:superfamily I DNA/RNA helicase
VFCDEAQDFTRVELDLIFRLCLFVDRKLDLTKIKRVPFAFAGDPFQTLNPTGFRWDAIQASFHDKLLDTLGENLYQSKEIQLNYQELNLNYRSTKNIVKLCNSIQALRAALFDITDLKPQRTWQMEEDSPMPVWFDKRKLVDWQQLGNEKDITIIVPCMLNEEKDYVQKDEHLNRMVRKDESGVPANVLSPARAKGLEFGRVVLYGFADSELGDLVGLLDEQESDPDRRLPKNILSTSSMSARAGRRSGCSSSTARRGSTNYGKSPTTNRCRRKSGRGSPKGKESGAMRLVDSMSERKTAGGRIAVIRWKMRNSWSSRVWQCVTRSCCAPQSCCMRTSKSRYRPGCAVLMP